MHGVCSVYDVGKVSDYTVQYDRLVEHIARAGGKLPAHNVT